jgi:thiol-disulfide isomerase/thioredoxin
MLSRTLAVLLAAGVCACGSVISDVREAIARGDFSQAAERIQTYRQRIGVTPEMIEALSWMARGELAKKDYANAGKYADETQQLSVEELKKRPLDRDTVLPIALGAAIEVQGNVLAARGARSEAVAYLKEQLKLYYATSIRARIQKNILLLTMEGKPAPALDRVSLAKGQPVLLFFWAHWCGDCKSEVPILAKLKAEFAPKGLAIVAPTQKYGYVARGEEALPQAELAYIEDVRKRFYADVIDVPAPVSEENFRNYGASTTPTLVLVDRAGIVRLYHPGTMSYEDLRARIESVLK